MFQAIGPRALPWAGISRPFGAWRAISTMQVIEEGAAPGGGQLDEDRAGFAKPLALQTVRIRARREDSPVRSGARTVPVRRAPHRSGATGGS